MKSTVAFFAWTAPAIVPDSPVDHTWVTTYDNRVHAYPDDAAVARAGESYWYCWGSFHATGGTPASPAGYLGKQAGDLAYAQCLVAPNRDSRSVAAARGTIFTYGVDGVCHQLANQVLYATSTAGRPLTVKGARGYVASAYIYGTYGLQHAAWAAKKSSCGTMALPGRPARRTLRSRKSAPFSMAIESDDLSRELDEFEETARGVLKDEPRMLAQLLSLRAEVRTFSMQRFPGANAPSAETLNARNQHMLDEAARLLGPNKFMEIFGYSPTERLNLVDPAMKESDSRFPLKAN